MPQAAEVPSWLYNTEATGLDAFRCHSRECHTQCCLICILVPPLMPLYRHLSQGRLPQVWTGILSICIDQKPSHKTCTYYIVHAQHCISVIPASLALLCSCDMTSSIQVLHDA